jgi:hypothetical protein
VKSERVSSGRVGREDGRLLLASFTAPFAWITAFLLNTVLSAWVCATGDRWILSVVTLVAFLVAAAGGFVSWKSWRSASEGGESDDPTPSRRRFMAAGGLLLSIVFLVAILALAIPGVVHRPCD